MRSEISFREGESGSCLMLFGTITPGDELEAICSQLRALVAHEDLLLRICLSSMIACIIYIRHDIVSLSIANQMLNRVGQV